MLDCILYNSYFSAEVLVFLVFLVCVALSEWRVSPRLHGLTFQYHYYLMSSTVTDIRELCIN